MVRLLFLSLFFLSTALFAEGRHISFLLRSGHVQQAYEAYARETVGQSAHDYAFLRKMGRVLLERAVAGEDPQQNLIALLGIRVAQDDALQDLLVRSVYHQTPEVSFIALQMLDQQGGGQVDAARLHAAKSPILLLRLVALEQLAKSHHPSSIGQVEALYHKLPRELQPVAAPLYLACDAPLAKRRLRRMLTDANMQVRTAVLRAIVEDNLSEYASHTRLGSLHSPAEEELCATAAALFEDEAAKESLLRMVKSRYATVRIAALLALHRLGEEQAASQIEQLASQGNSWAITAIGTIPSARETLASLLHHPDREARYNAALALLQMQDSRAVPFVTEILLSPTLDLAVEEESSPGGCLTRYRIAKRTNPKEAEQLRKRIVTLAAALPQETFLPLARHLFTLGHSPTEPCVVKALESLATADSIALLKEGAHSKTNPLLRMCAILSLCQLHEPGPYQEQLIAWLKAEGAHIPVLFYAEGPESLTSARSTHIFALEDRAKLVLESLEYLATQQSTESINTLLYLLAYGHPTNHPIIGALLMRAGT